MADENEGAVISDRPLVIGFKALCEYVFAHWLDCLTNGRKPKTFCVLGPPGIGKSATAGVITKMMEDYLRKNPSLLFGETPVKDPEAACRILDFSSMLPEDLNGLPFRDGQVTRYCPQQWVHELVGDTAFGVVVQDDLPAAAPAMHTAGRQMALERRIHDHRFSDAVVVMVTGNRREDKAAAGILPSHFRNSVVMLGIEPELTEWKRWYNKEGLHPIVAAFLTWKPELLSQSPKSEDKMGCFATPRQWASLGEQYAVAQKAGKDVLLAVTSGLVGMPVATTFCAFVDVYSKLPDPEKVLHNPKGEISDPDAVLSSPDRRIAMTVALGDAAARLWKTGKKENQDGLGLKLMTALAHVIGGVGEYSATGIMTALDSGLPIQALASVAKTHRGHAVIGPMLDQIKEALLG